MDNPFNRNTPDWVKEVEKLQPQKPSKITKKEATDREIMEALKNFIRKPTDDYICHEIIGRGNNNELTYLASRSKEACVDKEIAWQCSKDFLKGRFPDLDVKLLEEAFYFYHDSEEKNPRYRKKYFEKPKKK